MINLADFDSIIDGLDDNGLRAYHEKLKEAGCYDGLFEVKDESDPIKLRDNVKQAVNNADFDKLRKSGLEDIIKEIELVELTEHEKRAQPQDIPQEFEEEGPPPTLRGIEGTETKEKLIQELIFIHSQMVEGKGIPTQYRERYSEIMVLLNEKYSLSHQDIQSAANINKNTIGKAIKNYKKNHPIERPDDKVVSLSESKVAQKLTGKVTAKADEIIEGDMELAIHIRDTYLKEAYLRGIGLMELVDTAIPIWFNIEGIYNTMMNMERENLTLKEHIKILESHIKKQHIINFELSRRNTNLNRVLISKT